MNPKCRGPRGLTEHLLTCPDCRAHARLATAWRDLPRAERMEPPVEPSDAFMSRTLAAIRADRVHRARTRLALAAAAALLFFFCVGTGHETAAPASGAEESYTSLFSTDSLSNFIPH
ncbi:MAG TPA: hypothetical protein VGH97_14750 [Thermoanaerobaculia bacterium]|jgi:hypothetical protein